MCERQVFAQHSISGAARGFLAEFGDLHILSLVTSTW